MPEGHDLRMCKLPACPNELGPDVPSRGVWANVCVPCRRGDTTTGVVYRESRGLPARIGELSPGAARIVNGVAPPPGTLEAKAKRIVPLAKQLERKLHLQRAARQESVAAVQEFTAALKELRDAAKALIGDAAGVV